MNDIVWYYNKNLKPQGPLDLNGVRQLISRGEIGPSDLVFNDREQNWKPACDWEVFEPGLFPAAQGMQPAEYSAADGAEWIVLLPTGDGRVIQEGPFTAEEILNQLELKRLSVHQYAWKAGLSGWCQIKDRVEFSK